MAAEIPTINNPESIREELLTEENFLQALEKKGPLKDLWNFVTPKLSGAVMPTTEIPKADLEEVISAFRDKNPKLKDVLEKHSERVRQVAGRMYAIEAVTLRLRAEKDKVDPKERKKVDEYIRALATEHLDKDIDVIALEHSVEGLDSEGARAMSGLVKDIRETFQVHGLDPRRLLEKVRSHARSLPSGTRRADQRKAAAIDIANSMEGVLTHLDDDLKKMPKYTQHEMQPYRILGMPLPGLKRAQVGAAGSGVARGIEVTTTVMETSALVSAGTFILATVTGAALTITPTGDFLSWSAAAVGAFVVLARNSYIFKQQAEQALVEASSTSKAISKVVLKHPVKAVATVIATGTIAASLLTAQRSVLRAQDIATHIEADRDAIEKEFSQIAQLQGQEVASKSLFDRLASFVGNTFGLGSARSSSSYALLESALNIPEELQHRMEIAIKAEAGDLEAQRQASSWNIPYSKQEGLGPKALALAHLLGLSPTEAAKLTGKEITTQQQDTSANIVQARKAFENFAQKRNLKLTPEQMANPHFILSALAQEFQLDTAKQFADFSEKRTELMNVLRDVLVMTTLDSLESNFFKGQQPIDPKEIPYRLNELKEISFALKSRYDAFANDSGTFSNLIVDGIASIYPGMNINRKQIAISPPTFELDFTAVEKLAADIQGVTDNITANDAKAPKDIETAEAQVDSELNSIEGRIDAVLGILNPTDMLNEIVSRRYGNDLRPQERQALVGWEVFKSTAFAFLIEFSALFVMLGGAAGRLREVEKRYGSRHRERIAKCEEKIVKKFTHAVNEQLRQIKALLKEKQNDGIDFQFPFDEVSEEEVTRALRTVGHEKFVEMGRIEKAFARGPFLRQIDTSNRYSDALYVLRNPKRVGIVLDELFPGFALTMQYVDALGEGSTKKGKKEIKRKSRWLKPEDLTVQKNRRVMEIAILSEQNNRAEQNIKIHEEILSQLKGKKIDTPEGERKQVALVPSQGEKTGGATLLRNEWEDLIFASQEGGVLDELRGRMKSEQTKINRRKLRIENLYKELESNPMFIRTPEFEKRIEGAFAPITVATPKAIEQAVGNVLAQGNKNAEKDPFSSIGGYVESLVGNLEKTRSDERVDEQTIERAGKQITAITEVVNKAIKGFSQALNSEYNGAFRVEPEIRPGSDGVTLTLSIRDKASKSEVVRETVQLNKAFNEGLEKEITNPERMVGEALLGPSVWSEVASGKFNFKPSNNPQTPLLTTYNSLWNKLKTAGETSAANTLRTNVTSTLETSRRKTIPVVISGPSVSKEAALENITSGFQEYLLHFNAERVKDNVNVATASVGELQEALNALENPRSEVLVRRPNDARLEDLRDVVNALYEKEEVIPGSVTFDYLTQKFTYKRGGVFSGRTRTMDRREFEQFINNTNTN